MAGSPDPAKATARCVLRRAVRNLSSKPAPAPLSHSIQPPYTPAECAVITKLAVHQPTLSGRRSMCAMVGLGLGAGLDGRDQRSVLAGDISELTIDRQSVVMVKVRGARAREVPIQAPYDDLVRTAVRIHFEQDRSARTPLYGSKADRKNVTGPVKARAKSARGTGVDIEVNRLRSTWLVSLLCAPIPRTAVMKLAGLSSARTLGDLIAHCPNPDPQEVAAAIAAIGSPPPKPRLARPDQLSLFDDPAEGGGVP